MVYTHTHSTHIRAHTHTSSVNRESRSLCGALRKNPLVIFSLDEHILESREADRVRTELS